MAEPHSHAPHAASHHHRNGHHGHAAGISTSRLIAWAFWINFVFMVVEFAGGWITNSLALLADAGHMLNDVLGLALAWAAHRLSGRAKNGAFTFGYRRAQVLAALANAASLGAIMAIIVTEAAQRLSAPQPVLSGGMLGVAVAGFAANLASGLLLAGRREESLNVRGAWLHLMVDTLGSVAAIVAALAIRWTGWLRIDPALSLAIAGLVAWGAWGLMRDSLGVLMEMAPHGFRTEGLARALEEIEGVESIHDLHVWQLDDGHPLASVHVVVKDGSRMSERSILAQCLEALREKFHVEHATVQIESKDWPQCATRCE